MGVEMVKGTVKIPACLLIKCLSQGLGSKIAKMSKESHCFQHCTQEGSQPGSTE